MNTLSKQPTGRASGAKKRGFKGPLVMACAAALVASCAGWQIKVGESGLYGSMTGPDHVTIVAEGFEDALKQEAAHIVKLDAEEQPNLDALKFWQQAHEDTKAYKEKHSKDAQTSGGNRGASPSTSTGSPPGPTKPVM